MKRTIQKLDEQTLTAINAEKALRKTNELFVLFEMGSQTTLLIKQHLEELGVYTEVVDPATFTAADVRALNPIGIILSGGPDSVTGDRISFDRNIFCTGVPTLGICLGFQMWAQALGATVERAPKAEHGPHTLKIIDGTSLLLQRVGNSEIVIQNHHDRILPHSLIFNSASTENSPMAVGERGHLFGVQFHPEVSHTTCGRQIFENFCFRICEAKDRFQAKSAAEEKIRELSKQIDGKTVLILLSGGSDSSVAAYLSIRAASPTTKLIFVYLKGFDRQGDEENVRQFFGSLPNTELRIVDATQEFLEALHGKLDGEGRRDAFREVYQRVVEREIVSSGADLVEQGTLHTDEVESSIGLAFAPTAFIKGHHNPLIPWSIPEITPLNDQVKDTARKIGYEIGVPKELLTRQPFPGPGTSLRIFGNITRERRDKQQALEVILDEELRKWEGFATIWQSGAILTNCEHTCQSGDGSGKGDMVEWFAVHSVNGFTAGPVNIPFEIHVRIAVRMQNEVEGVGSVGYRFSSKPKSTIEPM